MISAGENRYQGGARLIPTRQIGCLKAISRRAAPAILRIFALFGDPARLQTEFLQKVALVLLVRVAAAAGARLLTALAQALGYGKREPSAVCRPREAPGPHLQTGGTGSAAHFPETLKHAF